MSRELEVFLKERASGYYRPTAFFLIKVKVQHGGPFRSVGRGGKGGWGHMH